VMRWRSRDILERPEWSMQRALYKSMGYSDYDLERPLIGIANSWNQVVPVSKATKPGFFLQIR
jgi:dihydroxy-acid dehydratase